MILELHMGPERAGKLILVDTTGLTVVPSASEALTNFWGQSLIWNGPRVTTEDNAIRVHETVEEIRDMIRGPARALEAVLGPVPLNPLPCGASHRPALAKKTVVCTLDAGHSGKQHTDGRFSWIAGQPGA